MVDLKVIPEYVVKNGNGATLGGYMDYTDAEKCRDIWARRYERCGIDINVIIVERKYRVS